MPSASLCPCGTGRPYAACCAPLHDGAPAPTAESLMRSRYTAYALRLSDYVRDTWHPTTRPASVDLDADDTTWRRLQIVDTVAGRESDAEGQVEFRASYRAGADSGLLHERSRFVRWGDDRRWVYLDGEILTT